MSVDTVKRSKREGSRSKTKSSNIDTCKVVIIFDQKGGPDLHPIHITKAIEKEIGKNQSCSFLGNW